MKRVFAAVSAGILLIVFLSGCVQSAPKIDRYEKDVLSGFRMVSVSLDRMKPMSENVCLLTEDVLEDPSYVSAQFAGVFSEDTGETLYVKSPTDKLYPASVTKCMTALLVLENVSDLNEKVLVTEEAFSGLTPDASIAFIRAGWTYSVLDLLYGLLLPSGNEAANALAIHVSGSVKTFVDLMNRRAKELGMMNTHFMNPNGLHNANHYTTIYDLYLLFRKLIQNETFLAISGSSGKTVVGESGTQVETIEYTNTNSFFRGFTVPPEGMSVVAGKTGYTVQAGRCLILLSVNRAGQRFITVIAKAPTYDKLYSEMNDLLKIASGA
ncbi:MAG: D-alanyl-D-alanine carboxypeptidase, partial [Lachnospiraceae bacterium]|nr:D-alanyl-D-alanine carboxypeptidase [Lachnospiraceae bacterium]